MRESKANEVLRLNKAQADLIKTHNTQTMKLKLEFSMKEAIYKNKIKKMEESQARKIEEMIKKHDEEKKEVTKKLDELGC